MKPVLLTLSTIAFACLFSSCEKETTGTSTQRSGKLTVQTTNYPLYYFAQRIAGDLIDLHFSIPGDIDPAFWEPEDEDLAAFQNADLIITNGATYEKWAETVSLPTNTQLDTSKVFSQAYVTEKGGTTHSHGDGVVHSHDGIAFTTWLNMEYAKLQSEVIRDELVKQLPESKDAIYQNAANLAADLDALDAALIKVGENLTGTPLLGSHPVYQYLSRRYKLDIESVHWEPSVVPDDRAILELEDKREVHLANHMIWEGYPAEESVAKLEKMGISSVVFNPCGNRPDAGDWLSVMKENVAALESIK